MRAPTGPESDHMVLEEHTAEQGWPRRCAFEGLQWAHRQRSGRTRAGGVTAGGGEQFLVFIKIKAVVQAARRPPAKG